MITLLTGQVVPSKEEQNEKLNLMIELNKIIEQKDIDRDDLYQRNGVKGMKELDTAQLKDIIKALR